MRAFKKVSPILKCKNGSFLKKGEVNFKFI